MLRLAPALKSLSAHLRRVGGLALLSGLPLVGCSVSGIDPDGQRSYLNPNYPPAPITVQPGERVVAITYDDGPMVSPFTYSLPVAGQPAPTIAEANRIRVAVIDTIMAGLIRYKAPMALFVVGNYLKPEHGANADELMRRWRDYGVLIGSHTMSHKDLNTIPMAEVLQEIERDDDLIRPYLQLYQQPLKYFRFPLLSEGATTGRRDSIRAILARNGLKNATVSISNRDFDYGNLYADAELKGDRAAMERIGREYMAHMAQSINHWDSVGVALAGRPVRQVMLLHVNRINRDYGDDILAYFQQKGYRFITLDQAYEDPIYNERDCYVSDAGVSWLEHVRQTRIGNCGK